MVNHIQIRLKIKKLSLVTIKS